MNRPILVRLRPDQIDYADGVGLVRRGKALMAASVHTNSWQPSFDAALWKNRQSARCEQAGQKWLQCAWNKFTPGGSDLAGFIDVKGVEEAHHRLLVPLAAMDHYAYLLIDSWQHPDYAIIGWVWGHEGKQAPIETPDGKDRPVHCVPREFPPLRDPRDLFVEVKDRMAGVVTDGRQRAS